MTLFGVIGKMRTRLVQWINPNFASFLADKQPILWLLGLVVGLGVAVFAIGFRELIGFVQLFWLKESSESFLTAARSIPWYVVLLAPIIGGLIVGLMLQFLLTAKRTSGVADVMEARHITGRKLGLKEGIISAITTAISLGAGGSAGREGPMIHLGASFASFVAGKFNLTDTAMRTLLAAGAASAVAASFNAPIAGVLFAHEVILGHYAIRAFVPVVISSVAGAVLSRLWFGDEATFIIPPYEITSYWEFPAFFLLGIICAGVAVVFQLFVFAFDYMARKVVMPLWIRPVIGGFIVGLLGVFYPEIFGVGYETTNDALWGRLPLLLMIGLVGLKMLATAVTLASRFGGGVFSPALYLGALTGGIFGIVASGVFPSMASSEGLYAILGMGAVSATIIGAPISTILVVFELTSGYTLSIALLLTVSVSYGINQAIHGRSFFQWQLEMRGFNVRDGAHRHLLSNVKVMDFMTVLDVENQVNFDDQRGVAKLRPSDSLGLALQAFDSGGHARLPVVDEIDGFTIIAWASKIDAIGYYNRRLIETHVEEHS